MVRRTPGITVSIGVFFGCVRIFRHVTGEALRWGLTGLVPRTIERVNKMKTVLTKTFNEIALGEAQVYRNLTVFPLLAGGGGGPEYMTLAGALKDGLLLVAEVSESGSVPEILITNKAPKPVLILDGEELRGAKQNRASNTTVLVPANSEMKLNVSCTERGRWHYDSERFADSGVVMAHGVRRAKSASVSENFRMRQCALSDQGEVWDEIERLHETTGTVSPTRAMRDAFESQETTMEACLAAFTLVEGQHGFVFVANGAAMGLDFLSREEAYGDVHKRLLGSYVMEMLSESGETNGAPDGALARQFMERALSGAVEAYPSAGLGEDARIQGDRVCGSALVHEQTCVHAALFAMDAHRRDEDEGPRMHGFRQRRRRHL